MRIILFILVVGILMGCGAPSRYHDYGDSQNQEVKEEPLRFSNDPLLDGIYRAQYLEMLRRCGSGDGKCEK